MKVQAEILIAAPPQKVWAVVTDPRLSPRWNSNVRDVADVSSLPVMVGTTWTQVVTILGQSVSLHAEVVECDPPASGVVQLTGPGNPRVTTRLTEEGDSTRLRQEMDFDSSGGFAAMALRFALPSVQKDMEEALRRQKAAVEGV